MAILVVAEHLNGVFKKGAFEATTYGADLAEALGTECVALVLGTAGAGKAAELGTYGAQKVLTVSAPELDTPRDAAYAAAAAAAAEKVGATVVVLSQTTAGRAIAGRIAVRLQAPLLAGVTTLAQKTDTGFSAQKVSYTSKAIEKLHAEGDKAVISTKVNGYKLNERNVTASVEAFDFTVDPALLKANVKETKVAQGELPLPEAGIVVSAGRGLGGTEEAFTTNWEHIGALAKELGAATACSKPIGDLHWRPHHEHVGQTGVQISPDIYIAVGISGAIQHLAGVSSSKTIIVINKDPEAPFFKAADYGIVGDANEIMPRLVEAVRAKKGA